MRLKLLVKQGHPEGISTQFLEIEGEHCLIGRKDSDVILKETHCSRHHVLIYLSRDGQLSLRDLQSTNGTELNGQRVTQTALRVGDELRIGQASLLVVDWKKTENEAVARPKEVTVVWTKEDTQTLKEAARNWPPLEIELGGPAYSQVYVPGKGSRI